MSDLADLARQELARRQGGDTLADMARVELQRRKAPKSQDFTLGDALGMAGESLAGDAKAIGTAVAEFPGQVGRAATAVANDMAAGFQGVNPNKVKEFGQAIGPITDGKVISDAGTYVVDDLSPRQFYVQVDPETGQDVLYARTPEVADSPLVSAGRVVGYGTPAALSSAARSQGQAAKAVAKTPAEAINVQPSLAMRGPMASKAAGLAESFGPTAAPVRRDAERVLSETAAVRDRIADTAGVGRTAADAGSALARGAETASEVIKGRVKSLYDRVGELIPSGNKFKADSIAGLMRDAKKTAEGAEELMPNVAEADKWLKVLDRNDGSLTYSQLKTLRTDVGAGIKEGRGPFATMPQGWLKRMYGSLTDDMRAAAEASGPKAVAAWKRADAYRSASGARVKGALDKIFKAQSDEAAYSNVLALTGDKGARANIKALSGIKKSMPSEEWGEVVGTTLRRMGQVTNETGDEAFSAARFLTEWDNMSPQAKQVLFGGKALPHKSRVELDNLVKVLRDVKASGRDINYSRSGTTGVNAAAVVSFLVDPVTTTGVAIPARIGVEAMTNPTMIRALNSATQGNMTRLERLARGSSEPAVIARQILSGGAEPVE